MSGDCSWRPVAYAAVVACFFGQGGMVWANAGDQAPEPTISTAAQAGQALYRSSNCQSCHQLYGYGGFLGPDLTNAASRLPDARFQAILDSGSGRMPAFHFTPEQRQSLVAYLQEIDRTGLGTVRAPVRLSLGAPDAPAEVAEGAAIVAARGCAGCHEGGIGPDLRGAVGKLGVEGVEVWLREGRGQMPDLGLAVDERVAVAEYLEWYGGAQTVAVADAAEVPWFNYSR